MDVQWKLSIVHCPMSGHDMGWAWWKQQDWRKLCKHGLCHLQVYQSVVVMIMLLMMMMILMNMMMMMMIMISMYRAGELGLRLVIPLTNGWNMANGQHLVLKIYTNSHTHFHGIWSAFGHTSQHFQTWQKLLPTRLVWIKYDGKDWYLIIKRWNSWLPWLARACRSLPRGGKQSCCRKRCALYLEKACVSKSIFAYFQDRDARRSSTSTNRWP